MPVPQLRLQSTVTNTWYIQSLHDVLCVRFAFVTGDDLCNSFSGDTLFTVQAPTGTHLELPPPDASVITSFVHILVVSI